MADVRPFRAFRPDSKLAEEIASLPYDVFDELEARDQTSRRPKSFLNIDRPETQFEQGHDMYAPEVYQKADQMLRDEIDNGWFIQDDQPCFYIYEQVMDGREQTGIVSLASIDDYLSGVIKKHENTRAEKEADRIRHVDTLSAQTGPIFLCYRNNQELSQIIATVKTSEEPVYQFVSEDHVHNRIWVIDQPQITQQITKIFADMKSLYIADGHHRCASAVKVGLKRREELPADEKEKDHEFDHFLSVLFPDDQLMIMDYNRVVRDLNGLDVETFKKALSENFDIKESDQSVHPSSKGEFGLYVDDKWYVLKIHQNLTNDDPVKGLDVSLLQDYVLKPILGIDDPKTDPRIDFVGGIRGLRELEDKCHHGFTAAFSMYPTQIDELMNVADHQLLMPPKSTWFEPKLLSGLFIHLI